MYCLLSGQNQRQIAKEMNYSETWVSLLVNDHLFKEEYQKLVDIVRAKVVDTSAEVKEIINCAAPKSVKVLAKLLDDEDPRIKLRAASKLISTSDFAMAPPKHRQQGKEVVLCSVHFAVLVSLLYIF
jgi:hypothetical protein